MRREDIFVDAAQRAIDVYRDQPSKWMQMMITSMGPDDPWETSAQQYLEARTGDVT